MNKELAIFGPEKLGEYEKHGWLDAPHFFSTGEIAEIGRLADEVSSMPEISGMQMVYREPSLIEPDLRIIQRIEDFCPHHPGFEALIRGGRLQGAVEQLLGGPAVLFKDKINFKMPGGGGFEAHQDQQAGWSAYAPIFVTAMVSIDPATADNGCLELANGPRLAGLVGREWAPLTAEDMKGFKLVPVPTGPGDVLFFDSFVPHASKPNLSDRPRRILYLTYNRASDGDQRPRYYADKRANYPPDIDRLTGV
jgi:hypothetical protein